MKRLNKTRTHLTIVYKKTKSFLLKKILFAHEFLHGKDKKWPITTKTYNTTSHICAVILTPLVSLTNAALAILDFMVSLLSPNSRIKDYKCIKEPAENIVNVKLSQQKREQPILEAANNAAENAESIKERAEQNTKEIDNLIEKETDKAINKYFEFTEQEKKEMEDSMKDSIHKVFEFTEQEKKEMEDSMKDSIHKVFESEEIKKVFTDLTNLHTNAGAEYASDINHRKKAVLRELIRYRQPEIPAQRHHQPSQ